MIKYIILAPSCGGKSTLMRALRKNYRFKAIRILEMDEEVMRVNKNEWPDDNDYKDKVLVPKIMSNITTLDNVIYLASYVPVDWLEKAKSAKFNIILLNLKVDTLNKRNEARIKQEGYADSSPWIQNQLDNFDRLKKLKLIDTEINGDQPVEDIVEDLINISV